MGTLPQPSRAPRFRDRLSHLSFEDACKILGPDGRRLLIRGGALELATPDDLRIDEQEARVQWEPGPRGLTSRLFVDPGVKGGLRAVCSACTKPCEHVGGLLSILLEQKTDLGLAAPPPETNRATDEEDLVAQALEERAKRAKTERMKDILHIEKTRWDLIILDEGQRIKNWEAKTSRVIKGLTSRFALVLTGTPLENRLDDLHSVVAFVDPHRLGPSFRFLHRHQRRDEDGALLGFKNLDDLRGRLKPILLRRTRESVRLDLPTRTVEILRIPPTDEQKTLHDAHMRTVAQIVRKPYLTEMDLLRLRMALLMCRMSADSTFLVDKQKPGWSTKLDRLGDLFDGIATEPDRKVVLFSEWTTMLDLIEPLLQKRKLPFVRLDGSVPQKKRQALVSQFQSDPQTRLFLTTNAGSTGLNLQAANTVINVDLPWNPAVLEQRIARAHRMGQRRPVSVYVLVTEQTLEESLLSTLSSKRDLALAALDPDSQETDVDVRTQADDIKAKLEVLLGAKPAAPVDETAAKSASLSTNTDRLAEAGSAFLGVALDLLGAGGDESGAGARPAIADAFRAALDAKVVQDDRGRPRLSLAMPSREALAGLLQGIARLLVGATDQVPSSPRSA